MADLPGDAVAVVVAGRDLSYGEAAAVLQKDAARVVAIQVLVIGSIPVERDVLDDHFGNILAAEDREQGRGRGATHLPEVLAQGAIELEAIPRARHERPLGHRL